jgi:glucosamine--fructose-6-phosphate aminotransferase (isomerizing)
MPQEEGRSALYRTILTQPAVVRAVLDGARAEAARAAELLAGAERVFLTGTGTSSHAAVVGEHLLRVAGSEAYATTAFDFTIYPRPLRSTDALIAISHRGTKRYGAQAIARAVEAGVPVIGLTGQGSLMEGPAVVIQTAPPEQSATHTASYLGNLTALALIAAELGARTGADVTGLRAALVTLPESVAAILARQNEVEPVAQALAARGRMILIGAGPNAVTAREGALKVKESSYLVAEGFEVETALHGGLQSLAAGDVAVVIAAEGPALPRLLDAVRALQLIGTQVLVVADERAAASVLPDDATTVISYAAVPEPLSPVLATVPLQVLASRTADLRGTDPDSFRADDPIYKTANASYTL